MTMQKAVDAIVRDASWGGVRERVCRRGEVVGPFHFYWSCPLLLEDESDCVKSTQSFMKRLSPGGEDDCSCFWGMGLVPFARYGHLMRRGAGNE